MKAPSSGRYMVLAQTHAESAAPAIDVTADEAWTIARRLRAKGRDVRVFIMRLDGEKPECIVQPDDPLD